jgi:hypothetical protein
LTPEPSNNPEKTRPFLPHRPVFKETPAGDIYTPTRSKFKETFQRQNAVRRKKLFFYTLTKMSNPHASEDPSTSNHALTGLKNGASSVRSNINDEKAIAMDLENNEINGGTLFNKGEHLLEKHQMETSTRSSSASFSLSSLSSLPPLRCFLSPRASFSFVSDCNINDEYKNIQKFISSDPHERNAQMSPITTTTLMTLMTPTMTTSPNTTTTSPTTTTTQNSPNNANSGKPVKMICLTAPGQGKVKNTNTSLLKCMTNANGRRSPAVAPYTD